MTCFRSGLGLRRSVGCWKGGVDEEGLEVGYAEVEGPGRRALATWAVEVGVALRRLSVSGAVRKRGRFDVGRVRVLDTLPLVTRGWERGLWPRGRMRYNVAV